MSIKDSRELNKTLIASSLDGEKQFKTMWNSDSLYEKVDKSNNILIHEVKKVQTNWSLEIETQNRRAKNRSCSAKMHWNISPFVFSFDEYFHKTLSVYKI